MKTIVIGGSGHIGSYLIPDLVKAGHQVINISRGKSDPYVEDKAWDKVEQVFMDRDQEDDFAAEIAAMDADIVVDLINFHLEETKEMVEALKGTNLSHYLFCSSIWAHGRTELLAADPNTVKKEALDNYGLNKFHSEQYLKEEYRRNDFPATIIMPGQISGPGWLIISPFGNIDPEVFEKIARGEKIHLPNFGMETLHHVHAADVAQMFFKAITHRNQALGESFHAVAEDSFTLYGYAKAMYEFFGQEADIDFLDWGKWCDYIDDEEQTEQSYYHLARSGFFSIENAKQLIDYQPQYSTRETVEISIKSYLERDVINIEK
ncbi:NAD-dependent epimerase/dehydratase family protein [Halanaerobium kushneri]|uniref:Nucleoside-diphosphate-sugar epimerase n=1 Tax=Halanaerobium kushneri TaxID=56779 RepID=A0A1N6WRU5_9FIRM|nr:NAD-dependent epimerase/dehydratase family protein [Halanaerobium kushneri]SIQ92746.1 Nucleoside-diphosphate-sugar epimerase [Halanaerobium kushneri]